MEIRQQCANYAELVPGINKEIGLPAARLEAIFTRLTRCILKRANGRGANGHHSSPGRDRSIELVGSFYGDRISLVVKIMVFNLLNSNWLKSAEAHVQRDFNRLDAAGLESTQNLFGEMQSRCRCCHRAAFPSKNCLIACTVSGNTFS